MEFAFVKPQEGMIVKDPKTMEALPAEGKRVRLDTYWRRRIADGDVTVEGGEEKPQSES